MEWLRLATAGTHLGGKETKLQSPKGHLAWCRLDISSAETSAHTYQPGFPVGEGRRAELYWVTLSSCSHHPLSLLGHCHQYSLQFVLLSLELDNVLIERKHELGPIIYYMYYIHKTNTYVINPIYACSYLYVFVHMCMPPYIYICICLYLHIYLYEHVYIYTYTHTHTYICMNVYM